MRRALVLLLALGLVAGLAAEAQTARNATTVSRLPACNLARQGWWMSVNDANPDCLTGSGTAGSGYAICQCDPVLGWLTYEPGDGYVEGATVGGGLELAGVNLGLLTSCANGQVLKWTAAGPSWGCADLSAGSGTVTSVAVTDSAGVSATVANSTTTPNLTFTLGAITPTSVAASSTVTGSNLSGTNTGDQTTITGNAGTATALAANGANCSAGSAGTGVDASGNAEGCFAPGTVTSVAASVPSWLSVAGSPVTGSGTLAITAATGLTSHRFIGTCDTATAFGPCAIVAADLPTIPYSQISGTPSAGIGGTAGTVDNRVSRADGTGGSTIQGSAIVIDDSGNLVMPTSARVYGLGSIDNNWRHEVSSSDGVSAGSPSSDYPSRSIATGFVQLFVHGPSPGQGFAISNGGLGPAEFEIGNGSTGTEALVNGKLTLGKSLRSTPLASPPEACASGTEGLLYYDTSHALCVCGASAWINLTPGDLGSCS